MMKILNQKLSAEDLHKMASAGFGDMVKGVVDVEREVLALDAELHSDLEALLLGNGSKQASLWGVNLYPQISGQDFLDFDSMINIRPSSGNRSRGVENEAIRRKIAAIVAKWIQQ